MNIPNWLAGLTGANKFANNPANGFQATLGDLLQAGGHSILQHYRGNGGQYGGQKLEPGVNVGAGVNLGRQPLAQALQGLGRPVEGSALPPAQAQPQPMPLRPELSAEEQNAITARLNGQPWGRLPLAALAATGLRMF
jgi:hypothetical protein